MSKNKTCIAHSVVASDVFCEMHEATRLLYLYLCFEANTDGVIEGTRAALAYSGAQKDSLDELIGAGFLFPLKNGAYLLAHQWVSNNLDRRDAPPSEWYGYICKHFKVAGTVTGRKVSCVYVPANSSETENAMSYEAFRMGIVEPTDIRRETADNVKEYNGTQTKTKERNSREPQRKRNGKGKGCGEGEDCTASILDTLPCPECGAERSYSARNNTAYCPQCKLDYGIDSDGSIALIP